MMILKSYEGKMTKCLGAVQQNKQVPRDLEDSPETRGLTQKLFPCDVMLKLLREGLKILRTKLMIPSQLLQLLCVRERLLNLISNNICNGNKV